MSWSLFSNKFKITKENFILIFCSLSMLLFNISDVINILITALLAVFFIKEDIFAVLCVYIFISFFDDVLVVERLGGSISRIFIIIITVRLMIYIIKYKMPITKKEIFIGSFFVISSLVAFFAENFKLEDIIILLNIGVFLMFSVCLQKDHKYQMNEKLKFFLLSILIAVVIANIYGITRNLVLMEVTGSLTVFRFKGTYEPNFMGMYINMAIAILLFAPKVITSNKVVINILFIFLVTMMGMTLSISGLLILTLTLFLYLWEKREKIIPNMIIIGSRIAVSVAVFLIAQYMYSNFNVYEVQKNVDNTEIIQDDDKVNSHDKDKGDVNGAVSDNYLIQRFEKLWSDLKVGNIDVFTSGRVPIIKTFIDKSFNRNWIQVLLGNGQSNERLYVPFFANEKYAHNTYLDYLYNFGVFGLIIIMFFFIKVMRSGTLLQNFLKDTEYYIVTRNIRIILLLYGITLSLYTKRMFLAFFLL